MSYHSSYAQAIAEQLAIAISAKKIDVPVLPDVAQRVLALSNDPDSDASQLADIIQSDPTMGGHVIRIANSAAYTPNSNLVSLQQAITRLGMIEISNIAISTSINSKLFKAPGYEQHIIQLWQHALATALWAKEIARKMRTNVEAAFLCGLLHSIGKPVILQTVADFRMTTDMVMNEDDLSQLFNEFRVPVSQVITDEWGLPEIVTEAIIYYTHCQSAPSATELAATILFASEMATHMIAPESLSIERLNESAALEFINLYPDEVEELMEKASLVKSSMGAMSA